MWSTPSQKKNKVDYSALEVLIMHENCIKYARGCQECRFHSSVQRVPASEMHAIIRSWPFHGWAMDRLDINL